MPSASSYFHGCFECVVERVCVRTFEWEKKVRHIEIKNRAVSSNGKRIQLDELCSWFTQFNDPYTNQALLDMKFVVIHLLKPIHTY